MFALFDFSLLVMIFVTANAIWTICNEWKYYYADRDWRIIIFASLSTITLWVFYLYNVIKWLS